MLLFTFYVVRIQLLNRYGGVREVLFDSRSVAAGENLNISGPNLFLIVKF